MNVIKGEILKPKVGDVIEFIDPSKNRDGNGFYLICQNNTESNNESSKFFLINLNGKKGRMIVYYNTLNDLLNNHKGKYKLHSSDLYELAIIEKED
jgi:hypothetical protein